jgi:hypothetical protein
MYFEIIFIDEPCPKFPLGQLNATANAVAQIPHEDIAHALSRHLQGDWGEMDLDDLRANENALLHGGRLFSAYTTARTVRFWIITEADRSYTTILLPEDY